MSKPDTRKLVCSACSHENEVERVYCHNCGEKLDRSLLPKVEDQAPADNQDKVRKQVQKMMNPNRMSFLLGLRKCLLIIVLSAVVAAVFLACLPPDRTPPMKTDRMPESDLGTLWSELMNSRPSVPLTVKEFDINYFLKRARKEGDASMGVKFQRAFATLKTGEITVTEQRDAWGLPIYSGVTFKPVMKDGKWSAEILQGRLGRLGIHPSIGRLTGGKLSDMALNGTVKALEKELKQIDRLEKIETGDGTITLVTRPAP